MVVDRNGQRLLRLVLADHILIENVTNFLRFRNILESDFSVIAEFLCDDLIAELDALITDIDTGPCHEFPHLLLRLAAE